MICAQCGKKQEMSAQCSSCLSSPLLKDRYALLSVLGQGAEGVTYKSQDMNNQKIVVIKERLWKPEHQKKRMRRLEREAQVLCEIRHHQIPSYQEHFLCKEGRRTTLYIVQEYIEGSTLFSIQKKKRFTKAEIWELAEQLLDVLVYLQELTPPIIHRDIKPSNVLYKKNENKYYLIDFGSVRDALSDPDMGSSTYAGTFGYMPPEQVYGQSDCRTDLYGLGAMLLELLTRQAPAELLQYDQSFSWLHRVSLEPPYIQFVQKLCDRRPENRFMHARQARSILRSIHTQPPQKIEQKLKEETNLPSLDDFRSMIREELAQSSKANHVIQEPVQPALENTENNNVGKENSTDPLVPTMQDSRLMPRKKGWWAPKPPRKLDEPIEPLHPAVQLSIMALAVIGSSIVIQFVFMSA